LQRAGVMPVNVQTHESALMPLVELLEKEYRATDRGHMVAMSAAADHTSCARRTLVRRNADRTRDGHRERLCSGAPDWRAATTMPVHKSYSRQPLNPSQTRSYTGTSNLTVIARNISPPRAGSSPATVSALASAAI
jgi:hypothetical protein